MNVSGLSGDRFLIGNPIPVTLSFTPEEIDEEDYVPVNLDVVHPATGGYNEISLMLPSVGGKIDLSPIIKGLFPSPDVPSTSFSYLQNNYSLDVRFSARGNAVNSSGYKTFIRGYKRIRSPYPISLEADEVLKESDKLPAWQGFQIGKTYLNENDEIQNTYLLDSSEIEVMRDVVCDPFYIRFQNTKGGMSYWLFQAWKKETESDLVGIIPDKLTGNPLSLGFEETNEVKVYSKVPRRYYQTIKALVSSPMVQVYDRYGDTPGSWTQIYLKDSDFEEDNNSDSTEVDFTFDLMLNNDPRVIW